VQTIRNNDVYIPKAPHPLRTRSPLANNKVNSEKKMSRAGAHEEAQIVLSKEGRAANGYLDGARRIKEKIAPPRHDCPTVPVSRDASLGLIVNLSPPGANLSQAAFSIWFEIAAKSAPFSMISCVTSTDRISHGCVMSRALKRRHRHERQPPQPTCGR
jgi:hypothetical protein